MDDLSTYPTVSVGIKENWYTDPYQNKHQTYYTDISVNEGDAINCKING